MPTEYNAAADGFIHALNSNLHNARSGVYIMFILEYLAFILILVRGRYVFVKHPVCVIK